MNKVSELFPRVLVCLVVGLSLVQVGWGQESKPATALPAAVVSVPGTAAVQQDKPAAAPIKVTQIDVVGLKKLLKGSGKPLLINFWATWCPPCTEEFPDLVKLSNEYRGKVDFVTVSLDDLADINTYVPRFLEDMRSEMPAYLLHTPDESVAISLVSKDWSGNLPMTVLYDTHGVAVYTRNGKIRVDPMRESLRKLVPGEGPK